MPVSRSKKLPSIIAAGVASIGLFSSGYGAGYASPVIPMLQEETSQIHLSENQIMWFGSLNSLGYLIAIPFGLSSQAFFGRKRAMLMNIAFSAISWAVIGASTCPAMLLGGRLMQGVASGLIYQTVPTYVSEIASASVRGPLIGMMGFIYLIGRIGVLSICYVLSWRYMAYFGGIVSTMNFIAMIFMPDSPRWLIGNNKDTDGKAALKWLRGDTNRYYRELRLVIEEAEKNREKPHWTTTVRDPGFYKPMSLIVFIQIMVALSCDGPMYTYTETILAQSGFKEARLGVLIIAIIQFFFCICTNMNVEKMGRKILLAVSAVGTCVTLATFGGFLYYSSKNGPTDIFTTTLTTPITTTAIAPTPTITAEEMSFLLTRGEYFQNSNATKTPGDYSLLNETFSNWPVGLSLNILSFPENTTDDHSLTDKSTLDWVLNMVPFIILCLYFSFHAVGALNVNHLMCSELTAPEFTGMAAGCSVFICYGVTFYSTLSFLQLQDLLGKSGIFFVYSCAQLVFILFFMFMVPETSGDNKFMHLIWKGHRKLPICNWRKLKLGAGEAGPLLSYSASVLEEDREASLRGNQGQSLHDQMRNLSTVPSNYGGTSLPSVPERKSTIKNLSTVPEN